MHAVEAGHSHGHLLMITEIAEREDCLTFTEHIIFRMSQEIHIFLLSRIIQRDSLTFPFSNHSHFDLSMSLDKPLLLMNQCVLSQANSPSKYREKIIYHQI